MGLIDADALIEAHYNACNEDQSKSFSTWSLKLIQSAPTIDAVPVVRCKDCKHSFYDCGHANKYHDAYFFCADGERKEDDEDV